ncbi:MAG: CdaR family protein [Deltaproteobacteria bacterium]|nr:CdaR family protein [Deltaproteobacteria bacterium]
MKGWLASLGRHKGLKLLSLLLALALWFAVSGEERTETSLHLAVEYINLPAKMVITGEVPAELQVRVIGPRSIVNKLSQSRLNQTIDLSAIKGGPHTFYLGPNSFSFPRGVVVTRIQPNPITLNLASTITATLPIKPVVAGSPPEGYELKGIKTRPDRVTVIGPAEELTDLKFIPTHPIDVRRLTEMTVLATDLDFKNLHLSLKSQVPILAELDIQSKTLTRTIPEVAVIPEPGPANLRPTQVAVTVQGPWPLVKDLKPGDFNATVDTRSLGRSRTRLNVSISLPQGVSLVRVQPASVTGFPGKSP